MEEALRAGVSAWFTRPRRARSGARSPGGTADENPTYTAGHLGIAYINSKHEAEMEDLRVAAHGLPLVVVNPTFVLGPDDPTGTSNRLISRVLLRQIPFYVEGGLNVVDVRDVAAAHLLADRKGEAGERYLLGGRNFTLGAPVRRHRPHLRRRPRRRSGCRSG